MTIQDLPKQQRHEEILRLANEMADSGKYQNYAEIEAALRGDGLADARGLLDKRWLRQELNERCDNARGSVG